MLPALFRYISIIKAAPRAVTRHPKRTMDLAYFLVYLEEGEQDPKIKAFRDWLLAEYSSVV